ncbi:conserved protein of unknown function (plasmid) [Cupriavidus taiwanensis]|uniref:HTH-like domain-containing protein n=1 Tax=Cupriavidus taiwanensis TaxID=164546 RepID=A0A375I9B6_9BURK|nr:conserved hypothetical protein [Cupriavidus taiwanensis]SPK70157.1 conserved hypothetical protein [Cupriavidus taiwanensis]SPK77713.1 conserved protein of unknown function [Cupriavidus taiwanensis]
MRVLREGLDVKYAFIERNRHHWPISVLCEVLEVSPAGFHQRRQRAAKDRPQRSRVSDDALLVHIEAIHAEVKGEYGWPRMWKELVARGVLKGARAQADGATRRACPAQARVHRDDGLEAWPACRTEPTGTQLHGDGAESGLGERHHLRGDGRRLAVPGRHHRPVQPAGGGLVDAAAYEGRVGRGCVAHGMVPASPRCQRDCA